VNQLPHSPIARGGLGGSAPTQKISRGERVKMRKSMEKRCRECGRWRRNQGSLFTHDLCAQCWREKRRELVERGQMRSADLPPERAPAKRIYKPDKWARFYGSRIPCGAEVEVVRFYPRRRVMVRYRGELMVTMLWCLVKPKTGPQLPFDCGGFETRHQIEGDRANDIPTILR